MLTRLALSAACAAVIAIAPMQAFARDAQAAEAGASGVPADVAKRLSDPRTQVAATVALTALSEALLNMSVEPFRKAMAAAGDEGAADMPRDAKVRDVIGGDPDRLPGEIGKRVPQAMGAASGMAGAVQDMLPEIHAALSRMKNALPQR